TFGDDGVINKVEPLDAIAPIRIGEVTAFAVASETAQIAYWVETAKHKGKVFVIQRDMVQPGTEVGQLDEAGWGGLAFGSHAVLVRKTSAFVPEFPLTPTDQRACSAGGLQHPNEPDAVEIVQRLIAGTSKQEVATIAQPPGGSTSQLRLWRAS